MVERDEIEDKLQKSINKREEMKAEYIKQAELIGFKNVPETLFSTDQYGFITEQYFKNNIEQQISRKIKY